MDPEWRVEGPFPDAVENTRDASAGEFDVDTFLGPLKRAMI